MFSSENFKSSSSDSAVPPKRSEWRLLSRNETVFDYNSIKLFVENIFVKYKPIFVTITGDRKEIRLSLVGYLRKNYLEELLKKYNINQYIELRGVMNNEKILSDEKAFDYYLKKWPYDKQPEGYEDVKLTDEESAKIIKVIEGNIFIN